MDCSSAPSSSKKRANGEEDQDGSVDIDPKRVKMRDLKTVLRSEGTRTNCSDGVCLKGTQIPLGLEEAISLHSEDALERNQFDSSQQSSSNLGCPYSEGKSADSQTPLEMYIDPLVIPTRECGKEAVPTDVTSSQDCNKVACGPLDLDLNVVDTSGAAEFNSFYPVKVSQARSPVSECGSTCPLGESGSLKLWKDMKENGFFSTSHGGIPLPKQRGRPPKKNKAAEIKKNAELAKREQVNRFAKTAAPSGLLSGLNPGIINHVRNRKQVYNIIEAIVKSEKNADQAQSYSGRDTDDDTDETTIDLKTDKSACTSTLASQSEYGDDDNRQVPGSERVSIESYPYSCMTSSYDDSLTLKLSSGVDTFSEHTKEISNDYILPCHENLKSISFRGASVAFQWLEFLYQDIRGRLAALKRSRKRIRNVIQTELPYLLSKENVYYLENAMQSSEGNANVDTHAFRWKTIFSQMDQRLYEEGKGLERWLEQVKEMQMQCERGLKYMKAYSLSGPSSNSGFKNGEALEMEYAVMAAAASIYSTCNLAMSSENISCLSA